MPIYMNIDISLPGETRAENYINWHELSGFSWGCARGDKAVQGAVEVTMMMDRSASGLMLACCQGRKFDKSFLAFLNNNGEEVMRFTLENVLISSYQTGGTGDEGRPTESLTLNFSKITFRNLWQDASGFSHNETHNFDFDTQSGK
jgi:type VI secretion system secreted protein Hcp